MSGWQLAQINVGRLMAPAEHPAVAPFMNALAELNARREWFDRFHGAYQALWWVMAGHRPSVEEGLSRLWMLDRYGACPQAFTFKARFPAPGDVGEPTDMLPDPWCFGRA